MIFDTSYINKDYITYVNQVLGKSYSFIERLKKGGIGSSRLVVQEISQQLNVKHLGFMDINYANIELRSKGIIIHLSIGFKDYSWVVPYYKLHIYNAQFYSVHADGAFIKFKKDGMFNNNKKFLEKLQDEKIKYLELGYYDG